MSTDLTLGLCRQDNGVRVIRTFSSGTVGYSPVCPRQPHDLASVATMATMVQPPNLSLNLDPSFIPPELTTTVLDLSESWACAHSPRQRLGTVTSLLRHTTRKQLPPSTVTAGGRFLWVVGQRPTAPGSNQPSANRVTAAGREREWGSQEFPVQEPIALGIAPSLRMNGY